MSKRTKKPAAPTYYAIQIDDEGSRCVFEGYSSPRALAEMIADLVSWTINVDHFTSTWLANEPDGGERFEIGQE